MSTQGRGNNRELIISSCSLASLISHYPFALLVIYNDSTSKVLMKHINGVNNHIV